MDTSDIQIKFDHSGLCSYCSNFDTQIYPSWAKNRSDPNLLLRVAKKIKSKTQNAEYDCIIGVSGGLDSSYTVYVAKEIMGLNPLLFHVDAGWNSAQAVCNIESLVDGMSLDLFTHVVPWKKIKDIQLSFFRSQIPDQDLPQDAAFFSSLYMHARKKNIKYVFTGSNFSTECCREPEEWGGYLGIDKRLFRDIHQKHGDANFDGFELLDIFSYKIWYRLLGMRVVAPLNLIDFRKEHAENLLKSKYGWRPFKHKHHESLFTRFYESYWLPRKFGFEKRRAHFSSLIMTGQMSRLAAMERLRKPELSSTEEKIEFEYVAKKLGISSDELFALFEGENQTYKDYRNKRAYISLGADVLRYFGKEKRFLK